MYQSQYPGKFTLPSGVELSLGDTGEADPENLGVSMAVAGGWLIAVDAPPVAEPEPPEPEPEAPPVAGKGKKE